MVRCLCERIDCWFRRGEQGQEPKNRLAGGLSHFAGLGHDIIRHDFEVSESGLFAAAIVVERLDSHRLEVIAGDELETVLVGPSAERVVGLGLHFRTNGTPDILTPDIGGLRRLRKEGFEWQTEPAQTRIYTTRDPAVRPSFEPVYRNGVTHVLLKSGSGSEMFLEYVRVTDDGAEGLDVSVVPADVSILDSAADDAGNAYFLLTETVSPGVRSRVLKVSPSGQMTTSVVGLSPVFDQAFAVANSGEILLVTAESTATNELSVRRIVPQQ